MPDPKLSKLELQIMEALWTRGEVSIREIQESFPEKSRPSYGTISITINRMEEKKIVRRTEEGWKLPPLCAAHRPRCSSTEIDR